MRDLTHINRIFYKLKKETKRTVSGCVNVSINIWRNETESFHIETAPGCKGYEVLTSDYNRLCEFMGWSK